MNLAAARRISPTAATQSFSMTTSPGRWLVSQLQYDSTFTHNAQCVAVSTSSDATGSYNRYEFNFSPLFPD